MVACNDTAAVQYRNGGGYGGCRCFSVNVNHGPGVSQWASVAAQHMPRLREIVRSLHNVDIYGPQAWFPTLEFCEQHAIPVHFAAQREGDVVIVDGEPVARESRESLGADRSPWYRIDITIDSCVAGATAHWVRSTGVSVNSSWNIAPAMTSQVGGCVCVCVCVCVSLAAGVAALQQCQSFTLLFYIVHGRVMLLPQVASMLQRRAVNDAMSPRIPSIIPLSLTFTRLAAHAPWGLDGRYTRADLQMDCTVVGRCAAAAQLQASPAATAAVLDGGDGFDAVYDVDDDDLPLHPFLRTPLGVMIQSPNLPVGHHYAPPATGDMREQTPALPLPLGSAALGLSRIMPSPPPPIGASPPPHHRNRRSGADWSLDLVDDAGVQPHRSPQCQLECRGTAALGCHSTDTPQSTCPLWHSDATAAGVLPADPLMDHDVMGAFKTPCVDDERGCDAVRNVGGVHAAKTPVVPLLRADADIVMVGPDPPAPASVNVSAVAGGVGVDASMTAVAAVRLQEPHWQALEAPQASVAPFQSGSVTGTGPGTRASPALQSQDRDCSRAGSPVCTTLSPPSAEALAAAVDDCHCPLLQLSVVADAITHQQQRHSLAPDGAAVTARRDSEGQAPPASATVTAVAATSPPESRPVAAVCAEPATVSPVSGCTGCHGQGASALELHVGGVQVQVTALADSEAPGDALAPPVASAAVPDSLGTVTVAAEESEFFAWDEYRRPSPLFAQLITDEVDRTLAAVRETRWALAQSGQRFKSLRTSPQLLGVVDPGPALPAEQRASESGLQHPSHADSAAPRAEPFAHWPAGDSESDIFRSTPLLCQVRASTFAAESQCYCDDACPAAV